MTASLCACAANPPTTSSTPTRDDSPPSAGEPQLADGVTAMDTSCDETSPERCDGTDSNCDGAIDEGCDGAVSGDVVLALAWNSGADLDLVVEGPSPVETVDGRGACARSDSAATLERAFIASAEPGAYSVRVRRVAACEPEGAPATSATVSLSMSVLGRPAATFNRTLAPDEAEAALVRFEITR